VFKKIMLGVAE